MKTQLSKSLSVLHHAGLPFSLVTFLLFVHSAVGAIQTVPPQLYVNGTDRGDSAIGDQQHPLKSLSAAIARLPDPLTRSMTIQWVAANETTTGGQDMSSVSLELMRRMRPGFRVTIVGPLSATRGGVISLPDGEIVSGK